MNLPRKVKLGPCHLGHIVPCRVAGVAVGGKDLNWERIPLAEGRPGVLCQRSVPRTRGLQAGCTWVRVLCGPCHLGHMVPCRVAGVAVGGRNLNWERIPLAEDQPGV